MLRTAISPASLAGWQLSEDLDGAVLTALEAHARTLGWTHLRLETGTEQPDAIAFYTRHGYAPIPCFGHYTEEPTSRCFERALS